MQLMETIYQKILCVLKVNKMIEIKKMKRKFVRLVPLNEINNVLDLGCGKGNISSYFVKKGAKVTGVDIKEITKSSENFRFIKEDIDNFDFKEYDLIISSMVLHFFKKEKAIGIIERMKKATRKGGFNLLICMDNKDECNLDEYFYPSLEELKNRYSNWSVINIVKGKTVKENHSKRGEHNHNLIFILLKNDRKQ